MNCRLLIADGENLVRKGFRALLHLHNPQWEFCEADNGIKAILEASAKKPDLALVEYNLPKLNGLKAAHQISRDMPGTKIILMAARHEPELIPLLTDHSIHGLILKSADERELFEAIRKVREGRRHFSIREISRIIEYSLPVNSGKKPASSGIPSLTKRESEIFKCLVDGVSTKEITSTLSISRRTLDTHKMHIFRKCNVHSLPALIRFAYRNKAD